jgi:hypothetical protein
VLLVVWWGVVVVVGGVWSVWLWCGLDCVLKSIANFY